MNQTFEEIVEDASSALGEASERSRELEQKLNSAHDEQEEYALLLEWAHRETLRDCARDELTSLIF